MAENPIRLPTRDNRELAKVQPEASTSADWSHSAQSIAIPPAPSFPERIFSAKRRRGLGKLVWFVLAVVIPAIVSAVYFFGIAANMYVSEFYAVVRPASDQQDGGPVSRSAVNEQTAVQSNVVVEYIKSPELVSKLEDEIGLRTIYSTDKADFWSRLDPHASMETLVAYWNSMVQPFFDMTTGTVSVGVKAFDAADAQLIATQVIHLSEDLVNSMSQRARADAVRSDEEEVHKAGDQLAKIRQQMLEFRNQQQMIDPKAEATSSLSLISHLREELALAQANLDSYGEATEAPGAKVLRLRIVALQRQIAAASSSITSSDRQSKTNALSANVTSFEELDTKRQVAEKYYDAALSALERAQYDASRQASYLAVFVEPNLPQTPAYPKRVMSVMLTLLASLGVWIFGIVIFQSIREHV